GGMLAYLLVRLLSYGILGFVSGIAGALLLRDWLSLQAHNLSIVFAVLMLLWALTDLVRGLTALSKRRTPVPLAVHLKGTQSHAQISWLLSLPIPSSIALGIATAVLPCGFLAAAYIQAALLSHPIASSLAMMSFALA